MYNIEFTSYKNDYEIDGLTDKDAELLAGEFVNSDIEPTVDGVYCGDTGKSIKQAELLKFEENLHQWIAELQSRADDNYLHTKERQREVQH